MGRKILVGCGALSIVVFLLVVLVVAFTALGGGGESADSGGSGGGGGGEAAKKAVAVGKPVKVGDVGWTVTNARQVTELTSSLGDSKQGNFVVIDFDFTNDGNEAVTLDSTSLALLDGKGRKFETDTDTLGYVDPEKDIFLNQVNPGVTQQGEVIFTIADGAEEFKLQLGDTDMFSDENGYVRLGF